MENIAKIFYINLDRRPDRKVQMESEFARMGLKAERIQASEEHDPAVGCLISHATALRKARAEGYENVLIFEDDFIFLVDKEELEKQMKEFFSLNIPWDVLMLSYNLRRSEPYNDLVCYGRDVQTGSGYLVNKRFYDKLIANLEWAYPLLVRTGNIYLYCSDHCWKLLQPSAEWFCFNKRLGKQRASYSDISKKNVDYNV